MDPTVVFGFVGTGFASMAGAVAYLYQQQRADSREFQAATDARLQITDKRLKECDDDRISLRAECSRLQQGQEQLKREVEDLSTTVRNGNGHSKKGCPE